MGTRSRRVQRQWQRNVALAALIVAVIALVAYTLTRGSVSAAQLAANSRVDAKAKLAMTPPTEAALPQVAFLGDSYTEGDGATSPSKRWSTLLSASRHWDERNFGHAGSGYINPGLTGDGQGSYSSRIGNLAATVPTIVIVAGGQNDASVSGDVSTAVANTFAALRKQLPKARIIAVGPTWPGSSPPQRITDVDAAVAAAAKANDAQYVRGLDWLADPTGLMIADGTHPNDKGYALIAKHINAAIPASL